MLLLFLSKDAVLFVDFIDMFILVLFGKLDNKK